jgi:hypothetical protein
MTMNDRSPRWVRWWFRGAALYGAVALVPGYFTAVTPETALPHYGFVGTALAFQLAFWIIGGDPARYRPLMIAGVAEKLAFGVPAALLWSAGRAPDLVLAAGAIDLMLGAGFLMAWRATGDIQRS